LVEPLSDRPDRFPALRAAFVPAPGGAARRVVVAASWPHKGRWVLKLEGVDSIDQAEQYRGVEIRIGEEDLAPLPEGSYYHHQLRGLRVEDGAGRPRGIVSDLMETGAGATVLVVRGPNGELLIPLVEEFVSAVDVQGGRLVAAVPDLVDAE
jgi:16S rRNA processing protein RimM